MPAKTIPKLPLVCLKTADFNKNTEQVVKGKNTVIDFWTTRCTRCPAALDKLDRMAKDPKYKDVQFISICCDKLDGARNIIERDDDLRWQNVNHYFMDRNDKETAKKLLGFQQVPFYVVTDENGSIIQSGNGRQVDFDEIPGVVNPPEFSVSDESESSFDSTFDFDDAVVPDAAKKPATIKRRKSETTRKDSVNKSREAIDFNIDFTRASSVSLTRLLEATLTGSLTEPGSDIDDSKHQTEDEEFNDDDSSKDRDDDSDLSTEFELDYNNRAPAAVVLEDRDDLPTPPSPVRVIDDSIFDLDDF